MKYTTKDLITEYILKTGRSSKIDPEKYIIWLQEKIIRMKSEERLLKKYVRTTRKYPIKFEYEKTVNDPTDVINLEVLGKPITIEHLLEQMTAKYLSLESTDNIESRELLEKIKLATNTLNAVNKTTFNNCDCCTFEKLRDKYQFLVKR